MHKRFRRRILQVDFQQPKPEITYNEKTHKLTLWGDALEIAQQMADEHGMTIKDYVHMKLRQFRDDPEFRRMIGGWV